MTNQAMPPPAAPAASEPRPRPKMPRSTVARIGSATKANNSNSNGAKPKSPAPPPRERSRAVGAGRFSPLMREINASTPASMPPAKSPCLKRGLIVSATILRAARSGTAPSSALAGAIHSLRSFLATTTSRPSPTSRRPIFHVSPTRCANEAMSSGCVVGTISTTICGPASASKAASLAIRFCDSTAVSVPVWSMTRSDSGGTATSGWARAMPQNSSRNTAPNSSVSR